ncbi:hypothetical protein K457DRAFT_21018 [Linnemannia elongata AG-77]|uniref:Uncharacterized protein n=1 Tax=Linnemannia elongata AG-77 TaxID=1314771 RepID=A0A197JTQ4_9FUNG|nr:hypothetical protein K457DRAFT_21018 [Linnemannia elongata AG-77]
MHKTPIFLLLSTLCAQLALASSGLARIYNNDGSLTRVLVAGSQQRVCYCLKNTQTGTIQAFDGENHIRLFTSNDCTGSFGVLEDSGKINNAQWVNSLSLGWPGIPSEGPDGCPNRYAIPGDQ